MIQFDLMGTIDLSRDDGVGVDQLLRQPKRLALLAFLVTPSPGTWHRRDTLLAVFWPELDTAHARTALRNALYVLRQSLGEGVVVTRGDEDVSIDPARLGTDLDTLWTAIRDGRADDALERYRGEFLPGLHPGDSEGFDSWLTSQRNRLRTEVTRLGAQDADRLARDDRPVDALRVAQRVLEINPDETAVRRVMVLHDALGDRAGGLVAYEKFTTWLRDELGAVPSAETLAIAERLRRSSGATATTPAPPSDLPQVEAGRMPTVRQATTTWRSRFPTAVASLTTLIVLLLLGFVAKSSLSTGANGIGKTTPVTSDDGLQIQPALSPDGQLVAFAKGVAGSYQIWVQRRDNGVTWQLSRNSTATELMPRWSPRGDQIVYLSRPNALVTVLNGGTRIAVPGTTGDGAVRSASWAPRSDSILFVRNDSLQVKSVDGPGARVIGTGEQLHSCVWSRDSRWIACVTGNRVSIIPGLLFGNRATSGILIFPAEGGTGIPLVDDANHQYESPTWSPDSRELWVLSNRDGDWGQTFSIPLGRNGRASGAPERKGLPAQWISLGSTGIVYSTSSRKANIWSLPLPQDEVRAPLKADDATPVTFGQRVIEILSVSPDRKWLVYDRDERGNSDIYRLSLGDSSLVSQLLTEDPRDEFVGTISPDGRYLAYHMWVDGQRRIRVRRLADGVIEEPWSTPVDQGAPRWSPDGNAIAGWVHMKESGELFVLRRKPGGGWQAPRWRLPDAQLPVWAPDGRSLLFVTLSGNVESIPADSGKRDTLYAPRPGTDDPRATNVVWQPERKEWWFIGETPQDIGGIWRLPRRGEPPTQIVVSATLPGATFGPVFDVDQHHLYFVLDERHGNVHYAEVKQR